MSVRSHKSLAREILAGRDENKLKSWADTIRSPQRVLFSLTLDEDELIRWRAIEAIGQMARWQAESDLEKVRDSIRRLLWLMNDESGGLGWRSPEMIGEILVNVPELIDEFGGLLSAYLREEPFERGIHLAVSRVAVINRKPFAEIVDELGKSLENPDDAIRCHAASALQFLNAKAFRPTMEKLARESNPVRLYDFESGSLIKTTVGKVVKGVLEIIDSSDQAA
jgi:HEAT repeat protein